MQGVAEMRLCVYRTLWGVLGDCDGAKAGSPVLGVEEALQEIARWVEEEGVEEEVESSLAPCMSDIYGV